jgi:hypothetical protein
MVLGTQNHKARDAKKGEADRVYLEAMPKHLFSGKRKQGTHDRR